MSGDIKSLLPPNAAALEHAVEAAQARLGAVPVPVDQLWDPWRCPAQLLPWLAWAWSVDEWDPAWPEDVKREVISAAPEVHRLKGTRAAVGRALAAIGVVAEIMEWWQRQPAGQPGTFSVTAWVNRQLEVGGAVLTERVQRQIDAIVRSTKPVSRAYELAVGVLFRDALGITNAAAGLAVDNRGLAGRRPDAANALGAADAAAAMQTDSRALPARRPAALSARATVASAAAAMQIMSVTMEAA